MNKNKNFLSQGVTLIELVVSIVIITIAVGGIMALFLGTTRTSADPMIRAQSLAIAQSYMDEIMMQSYDVLSDSTVTPTSCASPNLNRARYNDVLDYKVINKGVIEDQYGCAIDALSGYEVNVEVNICPDSKCDSVVNINGIKRIKVIVGHKGLKTEVPLISYRADY